MSNEKSNIYNNTEILVINRLGSLDLEFDCVMTEWFHYRELPLISNFDPEEDDDSELYDIMYRQKPHKLIEFNIFEMIDSLKSFEEIFGKEEYEYLFYYHNHNIKKIGLFKFSNKIVGFEKYEVDDNGITLLEYSKTHF